MSCSLWRWTKDCDGQPCPGDCDVCGKEEEDDCTRDIKFLVDIIFKIRVYAIKEGLEPDDTIRTVANDMLALLEVATFNPHEEEEDEDSN